MVGVSCGAPVPPSEVEWKACEDGFELSGRHDGYRHLPGRPTHAGPFAGNRKDGLRFVTEWTLSILCGRLPGFTFTRIVESMTLAVTPVCSSFPAVGYGSRGWDGKPLPRMNLFTVLSSG